MNKNFLSIDDWDNKTHKEFLYLTNEIKEGKYNKVLYNKNIIRILNNPVNQLFILK